MISEARSTLAPSIFPEPGKNAIDTRLSWKCKSQSDKEIRFLRIYCTRQTDLSNMFMVYDPLAPSCLDFKLSLTAIAFHGKNFHRDIEDWYKQSAPLADHLSDDDPSNCESDSKSAIALPSDKILNIETVVVPPFLNTPTSFQYSVDKTESCNQIEGRFKYAFTAVRVYYNEGDVDIV